jgi:hypothetical protein
MARLDNVSRLLGRVLTTLDRNPALLESVGRSIENVGGGARGALEGGGGAPGALGRRGREAASRNGGYPKSRRARPHPTRDGPPGGKEAIRRPVGYPDPRRRNPAGRATGGHEEGPPAPPRPGDHRVRGLPGQPGSQTRRRQHHNPQPLALAHLSACHRCHQRGRCSGGGSLTPRWRRASRMAIQPRTAEPWSCHSPAMRRSWRSSRRRRRVVILAWCRQWWSAFVPCAFSQPQRRDQRVAGRSTPVDVRDVEAPVAHHQLGVRSPPRAARCAQRHRGPFGSGRNPS